MIPTSPRPLQRRRVPAAEPTDQEDGMRRWSWLVAASVLLALGPGAASAMAGSSDVRRSNTQLLISEFEPVPPATEGPNNVSISFGSGTLTITDTAGAVASGSCTQGDPNTVTCPALGVQS